jgi:hypothetical protein
MHTMLWHSLGAVGCKCKPSILWSQESDILIITVSSKVGACFIGETCDIQIHPGCPPIMLRIPSQNVESRKANREWFSPILYGNNVRSLWQISYEMLVETLICRAKRRMLCLRLLVVVCCAAPRGSTSFRSSSYTLLFFKLFYSPVDNNPRWCNMNTKIAKYFLSTVTKDHQKTKRLR